MLNKPVIEFCIAQLDRLHDAEVKFDIGIWGTSNDSHPLDVPEPDCGFAGCFIGWAAHQQWFDQFGLQLRLHGLVPIIEPDNTYNVLEQIAHLFGVDRHTLDYIILPDAYPTPQHRVTPGHVSTRLQALLGMGEETFLENYADHPPEEEEDWDDEDDEAEQQAEEDEEEQQAEDEAKRELDAEIAEQEVEEEDRAEEEAKKEDEQNGR